MFSCICVKSSDRKEPKRSFRTPKIAPARTQDYVHGERIVSVTQGDLTSQKEHATDSTKDKQSSSLTQSKSPASLASESKDPADRLPSLQPALLHGHAIGLDELGKAVETKLQRDDRHAIHARANSQPLTKDLPVAVAPVAVSPGHSEPVATKQGRLTSARVQRQGWPNSADATLSLVFSFLYLDEVQDVMAPVCKAWKTQACAG